MNNFLYVRLLAPDGKREREEERERSFLISLIAKRNALMSVRARSLAYSSVTIQCWYLALLYTEGFK